MHCAGLTHQLATPDKYNNITLKYCLFGLNPCNSNFCEFRWLKTHFLFKIHCYFCVRVYFILRPKIVALNSNIKQSIRKPNHLQPHYARSRKWSILPWCATVWGLIALSKYMLVIKTSQYRSGTPSYVCTTWSKLNVCPPVYLRNNYYHPVREAVRMCVAYNSRICARLSRRVYRNDRFGWNMGTIIKPPEWGRSGHCTILCTPQTPQPHAIIPSVCARVAAKLVEFIICSVAAAAVAALYSKSVCMYAKIRYPITVR